ncbi:hypothetical protein F5B19DRAFT_352936 [Rostrohypoxylon terebratum]|nr:hypothetical protein F5B19DRAFT_352936 [Rostrohypoxylon terebratum]
MSSLPWSLPWSRPLRIARPPGLLSRTRTQLRPTQTTQVLPPCCGWQHGVRSFSVVPAIAATVDTTVNAIISFHAVTNIPWFVLIPCLSIGANAIFRLPFILYTHNISQRRTKSSLVKQAWSWRIPHDLHKERIPAHQIQRVANKKFSKIISRIDRGLGTQWWRMLCGFLSAPAWLVGIECIRRICGGPKGILGNYVINSLHTGPTVTNPHVSESAIIQGSNVDPSPFPLMADNTGHLLDPSIAYEGCLWFPDLSVADPLHILPFAVSAVMVTHILSKGGFKRLFGPKDSQGTAVVGTADKWTRRIQRGGVIMALLLGPCTADMPVAIHLYWLTSSVMSYCTTIALARFMPIAVRKMPERCRGTEPTIIQPKRQKKPQARK